MQPAARPYGVRLWGGRGDAGRNLHKLLGYKKDELVGKNVSCLMPQPYSQQHNGAHPEPCGSVKPRIVRQSYGVDRASANGIIQCRAKLRQNRILSAVVGLRLSLHFAAVGGRL